MRLAMTLVTCQFMSDTFVVGMSVFVAGGVDDEHSCCITARKETLLERIGHAALDSPNAWSLVRPLGVTLLHLGAFNPNYCSIIYNPFVVDILTRGVCGTTRRKRIVLNCKMPSIRDTFLQDTVVKFMHQWVLSLGKTSTPKCSSPTNVSLAAVLFLGRRGPRNGVCQDVIL